MNKEEIYKICLFGDRDIGKTSLIRASILKKDIKPPICIDIVLKDEKINSIKFILQI
ncbi:MAG: hypothetical protein ACFFG0_48185 [Candidatus Thorarchaeota archaeon]